MSERNFRIETSQPEDRFFDRAKEVEKQETMNAELKKRIHELTAEHDRLMDEWEESTMEGQDELAHQLLEDAGKILAELSKIDPQTKEEKELLKIRNQELNSIEEFTDEADELTKKLFKN